MPEASNPFESIPPRSRTPGGDIPFWPIQASGGTQPPPPPPPPPLPPGTGGKPGDGGGNG